MVGTADRHFFYIGALHNDEIQAIAQCDRKNLHTIKVLENTHAPEQLGAGTSLIELLRETTTGTPSRVNRAGTTYEEPYLMFEVERAEYDDNS